MPNCLRLKTYSRYHKHNKYLFIFIYIYIYIYIYMEKLSWSVFHRITLIERPFPRYLLVLLNFKVGNVLLPRFSLWYRHG